MQALSFYLEAIGVVPNIIADKGVEKYVYNNRFGMFSTLAFPKFKDYDEFVIERGSPEDPSRISKFHEQAKALLAEGKSLL
jgi:hypothetical protein